MYEGGEINQTRGPYSMCFQNYFQWCRVCGSDHALPSVLHPCITGSRDKPLITFNTLIITFEKLGQKDLQCLSINQGEIVENIIIISF